MDKTGKSPDQLTICTRQCKSRCCQYITVSVDTPLAASDWDEIRWWLGHAGTMVTKDDDGWMLHISTRCRHLRGDNTCAVYEHRMTTCSEYDAEDCEFTGDVPYDVQLETETDLADYLEQRDLKRGREVARAIRKAAASGHNGNLIPLSGLPRSNGARLDLAQ